MFGRRVAFLLTRLSFSPSSSRVTGNNTKREDCGGLCEGEERPPLDSFFFFFLHQHKPVAVFFWADTRVYFFENTCEGSTRVGLKGSRGREDAWVRSCVHRIFPPLSLSPSRLSLRQYIYVAGASPMTRFLPHSPKPAQHNTQAPHAMSRERVFFSIPFLFFFLLDFYFVLT